MARGRMIDKVVILSQKVNAVSEGAENLYYRANISADDYGHYHARPEILKGQIYTLRKKIGLKEIARRVNELWQIGLIKVYEVNGERYLEVVDFGKHQTFKTDRPKKAEYPEPKGYLKYEDGRQVEPAGIQPAPNGSLSKDKLREVNSSLPPGIQLEPSPASKRLSDEQLIQLLISLMGKNNPNSSILRRLTEKRREEWIRQCRLLREADHKIPEEIEAVIRFSQWDGFWKGNILSMPTLREKWDRLWLKMMSSGKDEVQASTVGSSNYKPTPEEARIARLTEEKRQELIKKRGGPLTDKDHESLGEYSQGLWDEYHIKKAEEKS